MVNDARGRYGCIGVLGGMGPAATARFYELLIRICQRRFGARDDRDYPEMVILNLPIPDIVNAMTDPTRVLPQLAYGARKLERCGAALIAMPCNTAHFFYPQLQHSVDIPFLDMVEITVRTVAADDRRRVGLLATAATIHRALYTAPLEHAGIAVLVPDAQARVTALILDILAGDPREALIARFEKEVRVLLSRGAEGVILGCTDLPLLLTGNLALPVEFAVYDTLALLAEATIDAACSEGSEAHAPFIQNDRS